MSPARWGQILAFLGIWGLLSILLIASEHSAIADMAFSITVAMLFLGALACIALVGLAIAFLIGTSVVASQFKSNKEDKP